MTLRWNGSKWSRVASPSPGSTAVLAGVSALSGTNAWAVGSDRNAKTGVTDTLVLHWNGTKWTRA